MDLPKYISLFLNIISLQVFDKIKETYTAIELDLRNDSDEIQDILGEITGARTVRILLLFLQVKNLKQNARLSSIKHNYDWKYIIFLGAKSFHQRQLCRWWLWCEGIIRKRRASNSGCCIDCFQFIQPKYTWYTYTNKNSLLTKKNQEYFHFISTLIYNPLYIYCV